VELVMPRDTSLQYVQLQHLKRIDDCVEASGERRLGVSVSREPGF
jgi:hypothetical protein